MSLKQILMVSTLALAVPSISIAQNAPPELNGALENSQRAAAESIVLSDISPIRLAALKEAGLGYGVRAGLARRSYEIAQILATHASMLDGIYNFAAMWLEKNVMPPVLMESQSSLNLPDGDTFRVADATYRIEAQARFVTAPSNWRDYLLRDYSFSSEVPVGALLPKDGTEKRVWQQFVAEGWALGVQQADQIFDTSLARLERDYKGMILYKSLLAKGMIGKPYVAEANLGVTGSGNAININDRVLRITAKPQLQTDASKWRPLVVPQ